MGTSRSRVAVRLTALFAVFAGIVLSLALWSFDPDEVRARRYVAASPQPGNLLGPRGVAFAFGCMRWVGVGPTWAIALGLMAGGAIVLRRARGRQVGVAAAPPAPALGPPPGARPSPVLAFTRPLGAVTIVLALAGAEHLAAREGRLEGLRPAGLEPGGLWGTFVADQLEPRVPIAAAFALLVCASGIGAVLGLDLDLGARRRAAPPRLPASGGGGRGGSSAEPPPAEPGPAAMPPVAALLAPAPAPAPAPASAPALPRAPAPAAAPPPAPAPPPCAPATPLAPAAVADAALPGESGDATALEPAAVPALPVAAPAPAPAPAPASAARAPASHPVAAAPSAPLALLAGAAAPADASAVEREARAAGAALVAALADFRLEAEVVSIERGPSISRFELRLAKGTKVNRVVGLEHDIQLALRARSVRIIAPIPGRDTIGIEVPNASQEAVRLRELIESGAHVRDGHALPLFLGKDASGAPLVADLARMPHLLIAGATGSGKSVCMNAIICSLLATRAPAECKLILIDPKMVELSLYAGVPHLLTPVVTDMRRAPGVLEWAVEKMEERYALLSRAQVRHVKSWNALGEGGLCERLALAPESLRAERIPVHMPYMVIVIDEFADLMCVARKEVEGSIIRLAQKSRAVGIHLILATQRPTADVITGLIKSNMPCRLAFQVASKLDSRTILDKNGAESLLGHGDMLYLPPGTSHTVRAQGTFVADDEVRALCDHARGRGAPEYTAELDDDAAPGSLGARDDLFDRAVEVILETGRGSASLLQRRLEVGYARASRLMDQMTDAGLLGPFKGSKAREILIDKAAWESLKRDRDADG